MWQAPAGAPRRSASELAGNLKGARYALWKNPENLTENQTQQLAWIATTSPTLHRAYLLKGRHPSPVNHSAMSHAAPKRAPESWCHD
jgi:transposase